MHPSRPISTLPPTSRPPRAVMPAPPAQAAGPGLAGRSAAEQAAQLRRLPAAGRSSALLAVQRTLGNRHAQKVARAAQAPPAKKKEGFPPPKEATSAELLQALEKAAAPAADGTISRTAVFKALVAAPYAARQDIVVSLYLDTIFPQDSSERLALSALQAYGPVAYWPLEVYTRLMKEDAPLFHQVADLAQEWKIDESPHVLEERQKAVLEGKEPPAAPPPIKAFFVPGRTADVALVLGGVHGDEPSGVEVAEKLIEKLRSLPAPPLFTVVVVPRLFAANVEAGRRETPGTDSEVNRNFPTIGTGTDTAAKKKTYLGTTGFPLDSRGRRIQPENLALLELIRKFKPVRIASVHAHPEVKSAGVFAEVHKTAPHASDTEKDKAKAHSEKDSALALEMAKQISEKFPQLNQGNRLGKKGQTTEFPPGDASKGVSFGEYMRVPVEGHRPSITTFTVEVSGTARSGQTAPKPAADRAKQLEAYADALLEVLLNKAP